MRVALCKRRRRGRADGRRGHSVSSALSPLRAMSRARASPRAPRELLAALAALAALGTLGTLAAATQPAAAQDDILYDITEEEFYEMPELFALDEWAGCLATRGAYCVGSFELQPAPAASSDSAARRLYRRMQRYSANWVDNYNHTRLHRGVCVTRRCPRAAATAAGTAAAGHEDHKLDAWFSSCVNASTMSAYNLSARLYRLDYCQRGAGAGAAGAGAAGAGAGQHARGELSGSQRGFAALAAALLALAAVSTVLDATLADHAKKGLGWALAWSVGGAWRALQAPPPASADADLRAFDGLRVLCMMCVVIEHVCWLAAQSYLDNVWQFEQMRRVTDAMLMANSTLVVQIFFLMSSFLLAHKLLGARRRRPHAPPRPVATFCETMLNRIIRVSPSYFLVVWFAGSWWARAGRGPLWPPLVGAEAAVCARKWWTHLLYLNNILYADDKCLIQTWYLAADMQLYALALLLTLALLRLRRGALYILTALLAASILVVFGVAYAWRLVPTFVMHRPELVRSIYSGESSFNVLYQSPLSNAPGALAGLLLAHLHHHLRDTNTRLADYKVFRWVCAASPLLALGWAALSPALLGRGPPARAAAAALAALERPVFSLFVALALLGAMHGVRSPLRSVLQWHGWAAPARLSFGVLLVHMPFNKALVAARLSPAHVDRQVAFVESFGVALVSYALALPLALLVEFPAQRLHGALRARLVPAAGPPPPPPPPPAAQRKADL